MFHFSDIKERKDESKELMSYDVTRERTNGDSSKLLTGLSMQCFASITAGRDAKSEEHEERAPALFPPAVLIFGLPTQKIYKNMLKYAKIC